MAQYVDAPEVEEVLEQVLETVEDHEWLRTEKATFTCLFRTDDWESKGRIVASKIKKCNDELRFFTRTDFLLVVNQYPWQEWQKAWVKAGKTGIPRQHLALIDHELCHIRWKRDANGVQMRDNNRRPVCMLVDHELEEFSSVVKRHGLWDEDCRTFFGKVGAEPTLFDVIQEAAAEFRQRYPDGEVDVEIRRPNLRVISGGQQAVPD